MGAVLARRLSGRVYLRIAQVALGACVVNVISGASVRLTDSGLGCADWPACTRSSVTPAAVVPPDHGVHEPHGRGAARGRRGGGLRRIVPTRSNADGTSRCCQAHSWWVSSAKPRSGRVVVYSKLNPYVVMVHFLLGMGLVALALALALRAGRAPAHSISKVTPRFGSSLA